MNPIDQIHHKIVADIERTGVAIIGVPAMVAGDTSMTYSVGLCKMGLPDIIVFGVPPQHIATAINNYVLGIKAGVQKQLPQGIYKDDDSLFNLPMAVLDADRELAEKHATVAKQYADQQYLIPTYVQWVWSDRNGKFVWEAGYSMPPHIKQPILGEVPAEWGTK